MRILKILHGTILGDQFVPVCWRNAWARVEIAHSDRTLVGIFSKVDSNVAFDSARCYSPPSPLSFIHREAMEEAKTIRASATR